MHSFRYDGLDHAVPGVNVDLDGAEKAHMFKILHLGIGEKICLLDGKGSFADAEISDRKSVRVLSIAHAVPSPRALHLYIAPPKKQKLDVLLKQCAELGVKRIVPMISERSVAIPKAERTSGRWSEILFEGCKQSGNPFSPEIADPMHFQEAVSDSIKSGSDVFYGSPRVESSCQPKQCGDLAFFVGPEGGFTTNEETLLEESGAHPLRIGRWTLRVETAVVAGIAVLLSKM